MKDNVTLLPIPYGEDQDIAILRVTEKEIEEALHTHSTYKEKWTDGEPLAPQSPPVVPHYPSTTCHIPALPAQLAVPSAQQGPLPQLNWSHFKPEFAGKPDEDAEDHLLRTNNWMDSHAFQRGVKVQMICLTLVGEARLWYELLRHIVVDWEALHTQFRQQYS